MINRQKTLYLCAKCEDKPHLGIKTDKFIFIMLPACIIFYLKYKDIQRFNEDI